MNKIYKLVWSKTKNMYVAVCEFARSHTKASKSSVIGHILVTGMTITVLSFNAVLSVNAANYEAGGGTVGPEGSSNVVIGNGGTNTTKATGSNNVVIGKNAEGIENAVVIGNTASSTGNTDTIAIGMSASVTAPNSISIGDNALVTGTGSVLVGGSPETNNYTSVVSGNHSAGLGFATSVSGNHSVALGAYAKANSDSSVALGSHSNTGSATNVVSLGHTTADTSPAGTTYESNLYRRVINMADGTSAHDGATVGQIQTVTAGNNVTINTITNSNGSTNKQISVNGTGTVTKNNTGLINGNTVYNELRPTDNGNYVNLNCKIS